MRNRYFRIEDYAVKKLSVSLDQIGLLREARKIRTPDPVTAAGVAEIAGADSISIHIRLDRRGIRERDLYLLKETCKTRLNLNISPKSEMLSMISEVKPHEVTILPERATELYTERGISFESEEEFDLDLFGQIQGTGSRLFLMVEPEAADIKAAAKAGCAGIQLYSLAYTTVRTETERQVELDKIAKAAELAAKNDLEVRLGGGLDYNNIFPFLKIDEVSEFVIGHAIVAQALMVGMAKAVEDMVTIVKWS
ncbi:MAG TPA: pyridoxine 5'-phosphate synthase [candidate division Zixibacteria bacterium]|nr:pyridoxine 5'-phosphate synthase [candidate division Zixibacteria bacterium]HEQ99047.1 pyridoxine 5'-phosphate synthase [candidate division Zixibacteria bacterium]